MSLRFLFIALFITALGLASIGCSSNSDPSASSKDATENAAQNTESQVETSGSATIMQEYTREAYDNALANNKLVFLDFYTTWCPNCPGQKIVIETMASKMNDPEVVILEYNMEADYVDDLLQKFQVRSPNEKIMTQDGAQFNRLFGDQTEGTFLKVIEESKQGLYGQTYLNDGLLEDYADNY